MAIARHAARNANYSLVANFGPTTVHPQVTPALRNRLRVAITYSRNFRPVRSAFKDGQPRRRISASCRKANLNQLFSQKTAEIQKRKRKFLVTRPDAAVSPPASAESSAQTGADAGESASGLASHLGRGDLHEHAGVLGHQQTSAAGQRTALHLAADEALVGVGVHDQQWRICLVQRPQHRVAAR